MMELLSAPEYYYARLFFERSLAFIYGLGFLVALNQFPALLGTSGLLPVTRFLNRVPFQFAPSLFHWHYSDRFLKGLCWIGLILSFSIVLGLSGFLHPLIHVLIWLLLYFFYLSITNVGQVFYAFGWESMLCEAGFFMAFMGPEWMMPNWVSILILRWMLFRTEMGAGLIKIRGDQCWKDLTALYYHHETQPMPNPLSRYFHFLPRFILRQGVRFSHFVQLVAPFGLFLPQPISTIAGCLIIFHQFILIVGGNYAWLNWLTVVLGFLAISAPIPEHSLLPRPLWYDLLIGTVGGFTIWLSYRPLLNLFSRRQKMNYCWNRYHLVGAYGAFGSVTKKRFELIIEGSMNGQEWKAYEFKAKPGHLSRRPPQFAPYHLRLDWLMWFLPFSVVTEGQRVFVLEQEEWFLRFLHKLLQNDLKTLKLLKENPFPGRAPAQIRVRYYFYSLNRKQEQKLTGNYWKREYVGEYLPPLTLELFDG